MRRGPYPRHATFVKRPHWLIADEVSRWMRDQLKEHKLADRIADMERDDCISPSESRALVRQMIEAEYAPPA